MHHKDSETRWSPSQARSWIILQHKTYQQKTHWAQPFLTRFLSSTLISEKTSEFQTPIKKNKKNSTHFPTVTDQMNDQTQNKKKTKDLTILQTNNIKLKKQIRNHKARNQDRPSHSWIGYGYCRAPCQPWVAPAPYSGSSAHHWWTPRVLSSQRAPSS